MADPRYSLFAARAVFDPRLTATDVRVLAALGTYTNKQGWCNPKHATIAIRTGVSRATVVSSMKRLAEFGYVQTVKQIVAGRGQICSKYRVILDLEPLSNELTPGLADVSEDDTPMSEEATPRCQPVLQADVVPVQQGVSNQDDTQKEHSHKNIPNVVVEVARATISKAMIAEAQERAGAAVNLTSGHVHQGSVFRDLLAAKCEWQDILDAIDGISASFIAKGQRFHSWVIIKDSTLAIRDRRIAGLPEPKAPPEKTERPRFERAESASSVVQRLAKEGRI